MQERGTSVRRSDGDRYIRHINSWESVEDANGGQWSVGHKLDSGNYRIYRNGKSSSRIGSKLCVRQSYAGHGVLKLKHQHQRVDERDSASFEGTAIRGTIRVRLNLIRCGTEAD